jgi:Uncharacterized protein conserved in bacteria
MSEDQQKNRKAIPRAVTPAYIDRAALAYLEKYASSSENLRRILSRKVERRCKLRGEEAAPFQEAIDETIAKVIRIGLVDDSRYAELRTASLRRKGHSVRGIRARLSAKGLDGEAIAKALSEDDSDDAQAAAIYIRRRKLGPHRVTDREKYRQKDIASLARAGFSFRIAAAAVDGTGE